MANDITNQQLLDALTIKFDKRFDGLENRFDNLEGRFDGLENKFGSLEQRFDNLEGRFDGLEEMLVAVKEIVVGIANDMATSIELKEFKDEMHENFDNMELRLGRRIDATFSMKVAKSIC